MAIKWKAKGQTGEMVRNTKSSITWKGQINMWHAYKGQTNDKGQTPEYLKDQTGSTGEQDEYVNTRSMIK